jgi:hypothetical protein
MGVPIVVVPHGPDVAWVRFEEETRHGVDTRCLRAANRASGGSGRLVHRPLHFMVCPALGAGKIVRRHTTGTAEA